MNYTARIGVSLHIIPPNSRRNALFCATLSQEAHF
jgi:hypothetical protein